MIPQEQAYLRIPKIVNDDPQISHRQLAERIGISIGKANYLLKALAEKGQIRINNFKRAESKLKYAYLLAPKGIRERIRLTRLYLARIESEYDVLKTEIDALNLDVASKGYWETSR